jgi:hypothetical protein
VKDRIIIGNWKDPKLLAGEVFDVVVADYLVVVFVDQFSF